MSKNNDAIFLCITPDSKDWLESMAMRKDIPRSSLRVVKANREDVPSYVSLSDWSMFFIKPVYSKKASSPTKMGELLAVGVPLVCNAGVGDVDEIMSHCPQGFVVEKFSINEYEHIANQILTLPKADRKSLRAVAEEYYSLEKGVEIYENVYQSVLSQYATTE